jgi:hypothetical protein
VRREPRPSPRLAGQRRPFPIVQSAKHERMIRVDAAGGQRSSAGPRPVGALRGSEIATSVSRGVRLLPTGKSGKGQRVPFACLCWRATHPRRRVPTSHLPARIATEPASVKWIRDLRGGAVGGFGPGRRIVSPRRYPATVQRTIAGVPRPKTVRYYYCYAVAATATSGTKAARQLCATTIVIRRC